MHDVHTRTCCRTPSITARTRCRFGFQRRRRVLFAWLITLPKLGPLPQSLHRIAIIAPHPIFKNSHKVNSLAKSFPFRTFNFQGFLWSGRMLFADLARLREKRSETILAPNPLLVVGEQVLVVFCPNSDGRASRSDWFRSGTRAGQLRLETSLVSLFCGAEPVRCNLPAR